MSASAAKSKKRTKVPARKKKINMKTDNLEQNLKSTSDIADVVECYNKNEADDLICLIHNIHKSFDTIIQSRTTGISFLNRTNTSLMYNINLHRILDEHHPLSYDKLREICFGPGFNLLSDAEKEERSGLLLWYQEAQNKPVLCQIVNPYDTKSRKTQTAVLHALSRVTDSKEPFSQPWKNLDGIKLEHFLNFQEKLYEKGRLKKGDRETVPVPLLIEKMVELCQKYFPKRGITFQNIKKNTYDNFIKKRKITKFPRQEQARQEFQEWLGNRKPKGSEGGGIYKLTGSILNWLGNNQSGVSLLTPDANDWMKAPNSAQFNLQPIIIQELTDTNYKTTYPDFTAVGKEIEINRERSRRCILIVTENYNHLQTMENDMINLNDLERNLDQAGEVYDTIMKRAKPIAQTFLRDAYKPLGNKPAQDEVSFICNNTAIGSNPTPYNVDSGLVCAVCAGKIQGRTGKWDRDIDIKQSWDVDHIANLIFNELFELNDPAGDGGGFLNTCGTCNRQFKSEKLWSPSWDLWLGLITKSLKEEEGETVNEKLQMYPWPGRLAPGVIDIPADRMPYQGYRVYMTQAYYNVSGPGTARQFDQQHNYNTVDKVRNGIKIGNALQQAEGINFVDRQEKTGGPQILESHKLEAIILNRFRLVCNSSLGSQVLEACRNGEDGSQIITDKYTRQVNMFGPFSGALTAMRDRTEAIAEGKQASSQDVRDNELRTSQPVWQDSQGFDIPDSEWSNMSNDELYGASNSQLSVISESDDQGKNDAKSAPGTPEPAQKTSVPSTPESNPVEGKFLGSPPRPPDEIAKEIRRDLYEDQANTFLGRLPGPDDRLPSLSPIGKTVTLIDDGEGPRGINTGININQIGERVHNFLRENRISSLRIIFEEHAQGINTKYNQLKDFLISLLPEINRNYIERELRATDTSEIEINLVLKRLYDQYEKFDNPRYKKNSPAGKQKKKYEIKIFKKEAELSRVKRTKYILLFLHRLVAQNKEKKMNLNSAKSNRRVRGRSRGDSVNQTLTFEPDDASAAALATGKKDTGMDVDHDEGGKTSGDDSAIETAAQEVIQSNNPSGDPDSLNYEIQDLRNWFIAAREQLQLPGGEVRTGRDPSLIETDNRSSELHWWSSNLILAALQRFAPNSNWVVSVGMNEQQQQTEEITDADRNIIIYHSGQGQNAHWNIAIRPSAPLLPNTQNGYYQIPDLTNVYGLENAHHRNGGDCGPAVVALALRAVKDNFRLSVALLMAKSADDIAIAEARRDEMEAALEKQRGLRSHRVQIMKKNLNRLVNEAAKQGVLDSDKQVKYKNRIIDADNLTELGLLESELTELVPNTGGGKKTRKNRRRKNKTKNKRKRRYKTKKHKRKKNKTHRKR